jgi:hypothetical protein
MLFETDDVVFEIFSPKKLATLVKSRRSCGNVPLNNCELPDTSMRSAFVTSAEVKLD